MKKKHQESKILTKEIIIPALKRMFIKLHFKHMRKNIVMFTVEICFIITILLTLFPNFIVPPTPIWFNLIISVLLFTTVLFANFAEAIAEGRGEAQAEFLKTLLTDTKARKVVGVNKFEMIDAKLLQKGDTVVVYPGEIVPMDGEIIKGKTTIDESAITGESIPVTKEVGEDTSSVTGGTKVISDEVTILINVDKGNSFLDKMINLVEESERQRTPNEQALSIILIGLTVVFFVVIITMIPITRALGLEIGVPILIALFVCLIPTTIGGLLSAIGIAGMNRVAEYNVIAMSGKAVELCGDVTAIILDKTGTITFGSRMPYEFIPVNGVSKEELILNSFYSSVHDSTPEGKAITHRCHELMGEIDESILKYAEVIKFSANSKMSGVNTIKRDEIRKGSNKAIKMFVTQRNGVINDELDDIVTHVANNAGTPLVVCKNEKILGVIHLKDTIKPGLVERFDELHELGIKTIMCTGDNELTARAIALEAHVDDYVAECKPEDKIEVIKKLQSEGLIVAMTGDGTNDAPALAVADIGIAMNSGTTAAKEAANMVDLDSDPTKILNIIDIGKELLITRGSLTTFSIANDIAKYFAIIPAIFASQLPNIAIFNIMHLSSPYSAIISAVLFNAIIIPLLIPIAMKGVSFSAKTSKHLLIKNLVVFGVGGIIAPFIGIKIIDMIIYPIISTLFM